MTGPDGGESEGPEAPAADIAAVFERVELMLLRGPRMYTRAQFAEAAGTTTEKANHLWRALGFASVGDDEVVFTDDDIAALHRVEYFVESTGTDDELLSAMTRLLGRMFARLAAWQGELLLDVVARRPELLESEERIMEFAQAMVPVLADTQNFVWRRQLDAYISRAVPHLTAEVAGPDTAPTVVGFADLSGYTLLARRATEAQLHEVLEAFETVTTEVVGAHNGRIIKTIGDEVLFVADSPVDGAEIAFDLLASRAFDNRLPPMRIGLAAGPVLRRLGDVYGSTVNIASRLTSLCRPGWVLIDRIMAESLRDNPAYSLKARRAESVRGFHHLRQWRLKRNDEERAAVADNPEPVLTGWRPERANQHKGLSAT